MDAVTLAAANAAAARRVARYAPNGVGSLGRLLRTVHDGASSTGMTIIQDSTAYTAGTTRWPYLFGPWLAARPEMAGYAVQYAQWDSTTNNDWQAPVALSGSPQNRKATMLGSTGFSHIGYGTAVTGALDLRVKITPNWTGNPSVVVPLIARWSGTAGGCSFYSQVRTSGQILFGFSSDGSTTQAGSGTITAGPGFTAGTPQWLRITYDPATGTITLYKAADTGTAATPATWTVVGSVTTNVAAPFDTGTTTPFTVGGDGASGNSPAGVIFHEVEIRCGTVGGTNGVSDASLVPRYLDNWGSYSGAAVATFTGSPVFTILNGGSPGAAMSYFSQTSGPNVFTRQTTPAYCSDVTILCDSHNENTNTVGYAWTQKLDTYRTAFQTAGQRSQLAVMTQNPKSSATTKLESHNARQRELVGWATRNNLSVFDVNRAFTAAVASGTSLAGLLQADGIHPSDGAAGDLTKGSPLWADAMQRIFTAALALPY